jgi:hypothetical protein
VVALYNAFEGVPHVFAFFAFPPRSSTPRPYPTLGGHRAPLAAASVAALATLAATGITLYRTNRREQERLGSEERRERKRLDHEERMQRDRLEHESQEAWRVERREAYSVFFSIARDIAASGNVVPSGESNVPSGGRATPEDLREAHATIELVAETNELVSVAGDIYEECKRILRGHSELRSNAYRDAKRAFLKAARDELGLPPRP